MFAVLTVGIVLGVLLAFPRYAHADSSSGIFKVSNAQELIDAATSVNTAASGSYTIELENDIALNKELIFSNPAAEVTICGNHTLTGGGHDKTLVTAQSGAKLNFGAIDGSSPISLSNGNNCALLYAAGEGTQVVVSAGSTISNSTNDTASAGVQIEGGAKVVLRGSITNCNSGVGFPTGGGVTVDTDLSDADVTSSLVVDGGSITNCSGGRGGAIFANASSVKATNAIFNNNVSAENGGAITVMDMKSDWLSCDIDISGCKMTGNKASHRGGAIYRATPLRPVAAFSLTTIPLRK